jgi:hypothetical protein
MFEYREPMLLNTMEATTYRDLGVHGSHMSLRQPLSAELQLSAQAGISEQIVRLQVCNSGKTR